MEQADYQVTCHEKITIGKRIDLEFLRWERPGNSASRIDFSISGGRLLVAAGAAPAMAVYCWSEAVDLDWVSQCTPDYFHSKCEASAEGARPYAWEQQECMRALRACLKSTYPEDIHGIWEYRIKESNAETAAYTKQEWLLWLTEPTKCEITGREKILYGVNPPNGALFFGDHWAGRHPDGMVTSNIVHEHLTALQAALAWKELSSEKK
ncbi:MAG: hypothetical protein DRJ03_16825 [Chloroflexi bacterium]|nr:MAG: hypothetical protein DRJ03_16825 [Chloroflexota bacterium]